MHTDYYQGLAARNQLLNFNDNIINRQYRIERKCTESDVATKNDSRAFVILNGGYHEFDKGGNKIYDKSNNLGFLLGYEKSCNENLTLGAFAGYSNTDCEQKGTFDANYIEGNVYEDIKIRASGNVYSCIIGVFGRYVKERLVMSGVFSGGLSNYDIKETILSEESVMLLRQRGGYLFCGTGDIRYKLYENAKFVFGPLVMLSYCYVEQLRYDDAAYKSCHKTLLGEIGLYGTVDCYAKTVPVRMYSSVTFAEIMQRPNSKNFLNIDYSEHDTIRRTREPSSYINVRLGVTSAVSESIDLNADVKGSFAKDYYDIMGAVGMSYNF